MNGYIACRHLGAALSEGESRSGLECPFCGGGNGREHSFSISRVDAATCLYICHRASCGKAGRIATWGFRLSQISDNTTNRETTKTKPRKLYTGELRVLGGSWNTELYQLYGIDEILLSGAGWGEDSRTGELVIPIFNRRKVRIGTEVRKHKKESISNPRTKVKLYFENAEDAAPFNNWFLASGGPTVVVEDSISALKVSSQYRSVAILGTHLNHIKMDDIIAEGNHVVLALDRDALDKAFAYQKRFGLYGTIRVAILDKDLKYETLERIKQIIEGAV